MKHKMKNIGLACLIALIAFQTRAQEKYHEEGIPTKHITANPDYALIDSKSGKYMLVGHVGEGIAKTTTISVAGQTQQLGPNEKLLNFYGDNFFTYLVGPSSTVLTKYAVNSQIEQTKRATLDYSLNNISQSNHGGGVVLFDENEGFGIGYKIFDKDLRLVKTYIPYEKGYAQGVVGTHENYTAIASNSLDLSEIKIAIVDIEGNVSNEFEIQSSQDVKKIYPFNDFFVLYVSGEANVRSVIAIDRTGMVIWKQPYILPYFHKNIDIKLANDALYVVTGVAEISILNARSGGLLQTIDLSNHTEIVKRRTSNSNWGSRISDFQISADGKVIVSMGTLIGKGTDPSKYWYENPLTILIDKSNNLIDKIESQGRRKIHFALPREGGIDLVSELDKRAYKRN